MARVVFDTSVLVAAVRSRLGASYELLLRIGNGEFDIVVTVPLVLEYEDALMRQIETTSLDAEDMLNIVDYFCRVAIHQDVYFLWRPVLRDPGDDLVLEAAVAASCEAIITHNVRQVFRLGRVRHSSAHPRSFPERIEKRTMSALSLRLPESLHRKLSEVAEREGVSINQLINSAVAEKMAALMTEEYLTTRARRGSRRKFSSALAKVGRTPPAETDRLPESRSKRRSRKRVG